MAKNEGFLNLRLEKGGYLIPRDKIVAMLRENPEEALAIFGELVHGRSGRRAGDPLFASSVASGWKAIPDQLGGCEIRPAPSPAAKTPLDGRSVLAWMKINPHDGHKACQDFYALFGVPPSTIKPPWAPTLRMHDESTGAVSPPSAKTPPTADLFEATGAVVAWLVQSLHVTREPATDLCGLQDLRAAVRRTIDDLVEARNAPAAKRLVIGPIRFDSPQWSWRRIAVFFEASGVPVVDIAFSPTGIPAVIDGETVDVLTYRPRKSGETHSPALAQLAPAAKSVIPPADEKIGPFFTALYRTLAPGVYGAVSETNGLDVDPAKRIELGDAIGSRLAASLANAVIEPASPDVEPEETEGDRLVRFFKEI